MIFYSGPFNVIKNFAFVFNERYESLDFGKSPTRISHFQRTTLCHVKMRWIFKITLKYTFSNHSSISFTMMTHKIMVNIFQRKYPMIIYRILLKSVFLQMHLYFPVYSNILEFIRRWTNIAEFHRWYPNKQRISSNITEVFRRYANTLEFFRRWPNI